VCVAVRAVREGRSEKVAVRSGLWVRIWMWVWWLAGGGRFPGLTSFAVVERRAALYPGCGVVVATTPHRIRHTNTQLHHFGPTPRHPGERPGTFAHVPRARRWTGTAMTCYVCQMYIQ